MEVPAGFEIKSYRFAVHALTHCATLIGKKNEKGKKMKNTLNFIVYFNMKYVTIWKPPLLSMS